MNNFNLDYEILRVARESLKLHGISNDILKNITKQYDQVKRFVENTYNNYVNIYHSYFKKNGIDSLCEQSVIVGVRESVSSFV